ncbi:uncharacterized protein LOC117342832 [Pecten maximus]|uniref:uncharacterized protein LOC117342832 n=1 Tax=Pecten maximus TaxID=6579 RepID=UPI001458D1F5|nr:uncharacterized protein LOC117342832 [Pecten maximus]
MSLKQAQHAVICEMCKVTSNVNWYCLNCEEYLCESCNSLHLRTKQTRYCKVIPKQLSELKLKGDKISSKGKCPYHSQETIKFLCQSCNNTEVCFQCILEKHSLPDHHDIQLIFNTADKQALERQQYKMQLLKRNLEAKLHNCDSRAQETSVEIERRERVKANLNTAIHARAEELEQEVTKAKQKMLQRVQILFSDSQTHMAHTRGRCQHVRNEVDDIKTQLQLKQRSSNQVDLMTFTQENMEKLETILLPEKPDNSFNFTLVPKGTIDDIFGNLTNEPVQHETRVRGDKTNMYNVEILKHINTRQAIGVGKICPVSDKTAWISRSNRKMVEKIDITGQTIKSVEAPFIVQDFTVCGEKDMVLTGESIVWSKDLTIEQSSFTNIKDFKPFSVRGITMATGQNVLVCTHLNQGPNRDPGKVVWLSLTGEILMEIRDDAEDPALCDPYRVAHNIFNDDIAIACRNNVLVYSKTGNLKLKWTGLRKDFNPHGITYDNYGNILVTCYKNNLVYMLEVDGQEDGHVLLDGQKHSMITNPWAVAVDVSGRIWLAGTQGSIHMIKYTTRI